MNSTLILDTVLIVFTLSSLALLSLPYIIYPRVVRSMKPRRFAGDDGHAVGHAAGRVSVIVPAHNEEEHIADKIEELVAQREGLEEMEIVVISDGSSDETVLKARQVAREHDGVRVIELLENYGKWTALEHATALAGGDILVMTDASAKLAEGSILALVNAMQDPEVGVATSTYGVFEDGPEADYWARKRAIVTAEAERDVLLGAHGACWAIRREALDFGSKPMIHDDYVLAMRARVNGWRVKAVAEAVAMDAPTESLGANYRRWVRMAQGNLQMISDYGMNMVTPALAKVTATLLATKLVKTLGPVWIAMMISASVALGILHPTIGMVGGVAILGATCALLAAGKGSALVFGLVAQIATGIGVARAALGMPVRWGTGRPFASSEPARLPGGVRVVKRAIDIAAAIVGLTLSAPILALCLIVIRLESAGGAIFAQERVSRVSGGREDVFTMYKLRTMYIDAEERSGPVWASDNDPRITRVGRILRKLRLDELPQFYNVLKGDMSLVGPRPERPHFTSRLRGMIPGYDDRVGALKPGITGLAQIRCGYDTSVDSVREKILHDLTYAAHLYSVGTYLRLEVKIILETVVVALTGRGSK